MHSDLRAELIKQFPAEVVENYDKNGESYYACPTCKRAVTHGMDKCMGCNQVLGWDNIKKKNLVNGMLRGRIEFELPSDFNAGDCRKCPLSYIGKSGTDSTYECPLNMRGACKLELI